MIPAALTRNTRRGPWRPAYLRLGVNVFFLLEALIQGQIDCVARGWWFRGRFLLRNPSIEHEAALTFPEAMAFAKLNATCPESAGRIGRSCMGHRGRVCS